MDLDKYRDRLQALELELMSKVDDERASARETSDDQADPVDQSVVNQLRDQYFGLAQTDLEILDNVRAALGRLDAGTFGICTVGGEAIAEARLDAVPWTPYCLQHQEELEAAAGLRTPKA